MSGEEKKIPDGDEKSLNSPPKDIAPKDISKSAISEAMKGLGLSPALLSARQSYRDALRAATMFSPAHNALENIDFRGLGLASLLQDSDCKTIADATHPDSKPSALAAKILSEGPHSTHKIAERLSKIYRPTLQALQAAQTLSGDAAKFDLANGWRNLLNHDLAAIDSSRTIADVIKRNEELRRQISTPVGSYYRDLLKRSQILSQFQESMRLCDDFLANRKNGDITPCVDELRKVRDKIGQPQYEIPHEQIIGIDQQLATLSSMPLKDAPSRQSIEKSLESAVKSFLPTLSQIAQPLCEVFQALRTEISLRLSNSEEVQRSQLKATGELLVAAQLTQQNVESLVAETQKNNCEIEELLTISKRNADTVEKQLATAEKNGSHVKDLLDASKTNFEASKQDAERNKHLSWIAIGIAVVGIIIQVGIAWRAEINDKMGKLIEVAERHHEAVTAQSKHEISRIQTELKKTKCQLVESKEKYDKLISANEQAGKQSQREIDYLKEKITSLCGEITSLKKQIEGLKTAHVPRTVPATSPKVKK